MSKLQKVKRNYIWKDRKRTFLGLPLSFTKYRMDAEKLYIETGFFNSTEDEVRLYRITDVTLKRSFGQKLLGLGTIHCDSSDMTLKNFDIRNVANPRAVKEELSRLVDESRMRNRVYTHESVSSLPHEHDGEPFDDNNPHHHPGEMVDLDHDSIPDDRPI